MGKNEIKKIPTASRRVAKSSNNRHLVSIKKAFVCKKERGKKTASVMNGDARRKKGKELACFSVCVARRAIKSRLSAWRNTVRSTSARRLIAPCEFLSRVYI